MKRIVPLLALIGSTGPILAQDGPPPPPPPPPPNGNYVVNGNFTQFTARENYWDGVDSQNFLAGVRKQTYAVTESGRIGGQEMPVTVSFTDMNGDKLPDLVTGDAAGTLRCYFNSGTKEEPKFTVAEVIPLYPPFIAKDVRWDRGYWTWPHGWPKIALYDWNRRGVSDLIFGNYTGDIVMVPNSGSPMAPFFPQPTNYAKVRIPTSKKEWGNLFAPCPVDWNEDGKPDLLIGEGSYSANAVYVLLNQGAGSEPRFSDEHRYYLCYGDGREQLTPTVADWNGDGKLDVLVGDRKGTIAVHLNVPGWKPGMELPRTTMVSFGNTQSLGTPIAPHAADYNGDGLFDLIIGKGNGRIAVAINTGTKGEPKFGAPVEIKGTNLWGEDIRPPAKWSFDPGNERGNLYAYISVTDEASPGGGKVLKSGYFPSPNKVFRMVELTVNGRDSEDYFRYWYDEWYPIHARWAGESRMADQFVLRQDLAPLKVGTSYQLSFKVRGMGIKDGLCTIAYIGANENKPTKFAATGTGRGAKVVKDEAYEIRTESEKFISAKTWTTVQKTFTVGFRDRAIKKLDTTTLAMIEFKYVLPQYLGQCEICDVQLVEAKK